MRIPPSGQKNPFAPADGWSGHPARLAPPSLAAALSGRSRPLRVPSTDP